jgi:hypothetical protein
VANILSATALGIVVPVLADTGRLGTPLGQLVIAAASIADFGAIVLLSLFFPGEATSVWATLLLLAGFALLAAAVGVAIAEVGHWRQLGPVLRRLQDSSAQIRVRGALLLLLGFAAPAQLLGLEVILGAFIAGALLRLFDRDDAMTHPLFRQKLDAVGFGVFTPFYFVVSGMELDLQAPLRRAVLARARARVPARPRAAGPPIQAARRRSRGRCGGAAAGDLAPFIVAAAEIWMELGELSPATGAALVVAGLLSVVPFPLGALTLLRASKEPSSAAR